VEAVGERSCRKAWKQALLLSERSCFSSRVAVFSNRLLSDVQRRCQFLQSLLLSKSFCLIKMGQSYARCTSECGGVVFQAAHWIVPLKSLTASSMSDSVLRGTCNCSRSLIRSRKAYNLSSGYRVLVEVSEEMLV
jgi:hypothetical protein